MLKIDKLSSIGTFCGFYSFNGFFIIALNWHVTFFGYNKLVNQSFQVLCDLHSLCVAMYSAAAVYFSTRLCSADPHKWAAG